MWLWESLSLTLDPEGDGIARGGAEGVGGGARVPSHLPPSHALQNQRVRRKDNASAYVLHQLDALGETVKVSQLRSSVKISDAKHGKEKAEHLQQRYIEKKNQTKMLHFYIKGTIWKKNPNAIQKKITSFRFEMQMSVYAND